jgi:hypothetical protein
MLFPNLACFAACFASFFPAFENSIQNHQSSLKVEGFIKLEIVSIHSETLPK